MLSVRHNKYSVRSSPRAPPHKPCVVAFAVDRLDCDLEHPLLAGGSARFDLEPIKRIFTIQLPRKVGSDFSHRSHDERST